MQDTGNFQEGVAAVLVPNASAHKALDPQPLLGPPDWLSDARHLRGVDKEAPLAGLALSGGGIRSATFSLGLIRALAEQDVFKRFDYLSTVSGGGYAGAAIGKLFNPANSQATPTSQPQNSASAATSTSPSPSSLSDMDSSWFVWWLRATSRYLTPRGFTDILRALATYLRSMLGVHFETAVLALTAGCAMALFDAGAWWALRELHAFHPQTALALSQPWMSAWWLLLIFPMTGALAYMFAYWQVPREGTDSSLKRICTSVVALAVAVLLFVLLRAPDLRWLPVDEALWQTSVFATCYVLLLVSLAPLVALGHARRAGDADPVQRAAKARNTLTMGLSRFLAATAVLLVVGLLDRLAWWFAFGDALNWRATQTAAGIVAASLLAARLAASATARQTAAHRGTAPAGPDRTGAWIGALGLLVGFLLLALWVGVAYRWVLGALFPAGVDQVDVYRAAITIGGSTLLVLAGYVVVTGRGAGFVNQSSLHMFYRARLARSYLGASNSARFTTPPPNEHIYRPLDAVPGELRADGANRKTVFDVDQGDLVALADYRPHKGGGPVHILNMTVNQTVDPAGGLFNQDRKGEYLSVTTDGWSRLGTRDWEYRPALAGEDLATWMAVSGAAAAPGLGAQTSKGLALICFLAGVRLGYWWDTLTGQRHAPLAKYRLFVQEMLANFPGTRSRYWFLSDGGHFDNTGAYALLRERAGLIVLADCGADPDYDFKDLENLVRKARIDLQTDIRFLRPRDEAKSDDNFKRFGTLHDLADPGGDACLALASIHYPDPEGRRSDPHRDPDGYLVLVKPNIFHGLPVDLLRYKRDNITFPQETTTDQFFSEAQWESYYRLGASLGESVTPHLLDLLRHPLDSNLFVPDLTRRAATQTGVASTNDKEIAAVAAAAVSAVREIPLRREERLRSGLGFTAVLAALLCGGWLWHLHEEKESGRGVELMAQTNEVRTQYEASTVAQCSTLRMSFEQLARRWCDDPRGRNELVKMGGRYDALARGCEKADEAGCDGLREQQVRNCYSGSGSLDGVPYPTYWGWPVLGSFPSPAAKPSACGVVETLASSAPTPTEVPEHPPEPSTLPQGGVCSGRTVYVQVFGAKELVDARERLKRWPAELGLKLPATEDVLASAYAAGRKPPAVVNKDVVIYNVDEDRHCAAVLFARLGAEPTLRMQAPGLRRTPGVIEVWLKPRS